MCQFAGQPHFVNFASLSLSTVHKRLRSAMAIFRTRNSRHRIRAFYRYINGPVLNQSSYRIMLQKNTYNITHQYYLSYNLSFRYNTILQKSIKISPFHYQQLFSTVHNGIVQSDTLQLTLHSNKLFC